ncbi:MAG: hypothetical protein DHS20C21_19460 [Gemmatimonadota bacterium]|nr:MAG: hypothetical protein DHS20C21_19460 [Gemmatimonadota bacterium]
MIWFIGIAVALVFVALLWRSLAAGRNQGRDRRPPYLVAMSALIDGDRELAFRELKNAVRLDSSNVDAYLRLGDLFRERGDGERALQIHRELTARAGLDDGEKSRIHESLCRDWMALKQLDRAAEAVAEAVRFAADPTKMLQLQLKVQEQRGDLGAAFRVKREILKRGGRVKAEAAALADFRAEQAVELIEKGELAAAEKILKEARKLEGNAARTAYLWGWLKEKQGDYAAALTTWESILTDHPEKVVMLFRSLERVHFLNGSYGDMESTYQRFLEKVPGHEDASFGLARFLLRKGQLEAALETCRTALEHHPESIPLRVLRSLLTLQIGRTPDAERLLNDWISEIMGEGQASRRFAPPDPVVDLESAT